MVVHSHCSQWLRAGNTSPLLDYATNVKHGQTRTRGGEPNEHNIESVLITLVFLLSREVLTTGFAILIPLRERARSPAWRTRAENKGRAEPRSGSFVPVLSAVPRSATHAAVASACAGARRYIGCPAHKD